MSSLTTPCRHWQRHVVTDNATCILFPKLLYIFCAATVPSWRHLLEMFVYQLQRANMPSFYMRSYKWALTWHALNFLRPFLRDCAFVMSAPNAWRHRIRWNINMTIGSRLYVQVLYASVNGSGSGTFLCMNAYMHLHHDLCRINTARVERTEDTCYCSLNCWRLFYH